MINLFVYLYCKTNPNINPLNLTEMAKTAFFKNFTEFMEREDKSLNGTNDPELVGNDNGNTGCWNCWGCWNCTACTDCNLCSGCIDCHKCGDCTKCTGCRECKNLYRQAGRWRKDGFAE